MALTKCEECSQEVSTKAETCPHCGAPVVSPPSEPTDDAAKAKKGTDDLRRGCGIGCLGLIVLVVALASIDLFVAGESFPDVPKSTSKPKVEKSKPAGNQTGAAWRLCKDAALERLVAPSTADFPFAAVFDHVRHVSGPRYRVGSWVDAENSFGAMIRTHFVCGANVETRRVENFMVVEK